MNIKLNSVSKFTQQSSLRFTRQRYYRTKQAHPPSESTTITRCTSRHKNTCYTFHYRGKQDQIKNLPPVIFKQATNRTVALGQPISAEKIRFNENVRCTCTWRTWIRSESISIAGCGSKNGDRKLDTDRRTQRERESYKSRVAKEVSFIIT